MFVSFKYSKQYQNSEENTTDEESNNKKIIPKPVGRMSQKPQSIHQFVGFYN